LDAGASATAVRSEAKDEQPSPAASNPTLSANKNIWGPSGSRYFLAGAGCLDHKLATANLDTRSAAEAMDAGTPPHLMC